VYAGSVDVHALLAMCAYANFDKNRADLLKQQKNALEYLGSSETVFSFSNFSSIIRLIQDNTNNYRTVIEEANRQKLRSIIRRNYEQIDEIIQMNSGQISSAKEKLTRFSRICRDIVDVQNQRIQNEVASSINDKFVRFKKICYDIIDDGSNMQDKINKNVKHLDDYLNQDIAMIVNNGIRHIGYGLNDETRKLPAIINSRSLLCDVHKQIELSVSINVSESLKKMDFTIGDFVGGAATIGGCALAGGSIFGPLGALIGAGIGSIVQGIKSSQSDGGRGAAKASLSSDVDKCKNSVIGSFRREYTAYDKMFSDIKNSIGKSVQGELQKFSRIDGTINSAQLKIKQFMLNL
ncbi:MAG: glycine zipper family protein, partial [Bacteroidales bacterium]|nr:glycine zipper family protein [Bacteroidales bacterium]